MPKTHVETIVDEMIRATNAPVLVPGVRTQIENMVSRLLSQGFQIIPPGTARHWDRQKVEIDPTSFFCPGCGTHKPPYGFTGSAGVVKGFGSVSFVTIYCGVDSCRRILQVVILGMTPEATIQ